MITSVFIETVVCNNLLDSWPTWPQEKGEDVKGYIFIDS